MSLVILASGVNTAQNPQYQVVTEEPGSGNLKLPNAGSQLTKCIRKKPKYKKIHGDVGIYDDNDVIKKRRYKCTTCNKVQRITRERTKQVQYLDIPTAIY